MTSFGQRLEQAIATRGPLCVGIDPHAGLLQSWGLADTVAGLREFSLRVVDTLGDQVAALKPQVAFFERHGSAGMAVLEEVIGRARERNVLTIVDAKRGDIGSTMQGYADAFCRDDGPWAGDAVTLSPYLGFGSLRPAIETALASSRGVFVLCLTSNPEGAQVQLARDLDESSVASSIARGAAELNQTELGSSGVLGSVGLVVGATIGDAAQRGKVDLAAVRGPLLMPGLGAQGGSAESMRAVVGQAWSHVLASTSREVLGAGPDPDALQGAARAVVSKLRA